MKQLTMGEILGLVENLKAQGTTDEEIKSLPVYVGDDDELNGIHTAYYCEHIADDEENSEYIELINADSCNIKLSGKAILIS